MSRGLLIRGGTVVTADLTRPATDVRVSGGIITEIGPSLALAGEDEIDASGQLVFPGGIDPHVHGHLPFMGTVSIDDPEAATRGAVCGGTTSVIEMLLPDRDQSPLLAFGVWSKKYEAAYTDYSYHLGVTSWGDTFAREIQKLILDHHLSLKFFLAYKGALNVEMADLLEALALAKLLGTVATAHCENADMIAFNQRSLVAQGKIAPRYHYDSRPPTVEAGGTMQFCTALVQTGATGYVVHLSCADALDQVLRARRLGVQVHAEALIQHLVLTKAKTETGNFDDDAQYVMSPPLREASDVQALSHAVATGLIQTIGSDHAPFSTKQKRMGLDSFSNIPNGMATIEHRLRVLYEKFVVPGIISLNRFVELTSTRAAQIFGMYPRKGTIAVGSDADIAVLDPRLKETLSAKTHHTAGDRCNFEGLSVTGRFSLVCVRGVPILRDGALVGKPGTGKLIPRRLMV